MPERHGRKQRLDGRPDLGPELRRLQEGVGGSWRRVPTGFPRMWPQHWYLGEAGVALLGDTVARAREGWAAMAGHPGRPELRFEAEGVMLLEPLHPEPEPLPALLGWLGEAELTRWTDSVGELLARMGGQIQSDRAMRRLGVRRRHVDRLLAREVSVALRVGPGPFAAGTAWIRRGQEAPRVLRLVNARADAVRSLDLAAAERDLALDLSEHAEPGDDGALGLELARLRVALEEAVMGKDEAAAAEAKLLVQGLIEGPPPERVRVQLEGPAWLDPRLWIPADGWLDAPAARRLLRQLDGAWIGGHEVRVQVDPPLRPGRRPPQREDRTLRRRRLFSRWDEGIQVDEEGLLSATPEALAERIAAMTRGRVIDGSCGVGAIAIALARRRPVSQVIAVDLDPGRLEMAAQNAGIYGVRERIRFLQGPIEALLPELEADCLVLDPPWGGRDYPRESMGMKELDFPLRRVLGQFPGRVLAKLPRSFRVDELPGRWGIHPMVDERGVLKFLVAVRAA